MTGIEDPDSLEREDTAIRKQVAQVKGKFEKTGFFQESILEAIDFYRREISE